MAAMTTGSALDTWLADHPYLKEVARFEHIIDDAFRGHELPALAVPQWDNRSDDLGKGIPLLSNRALDEAIAAQAGDLLSLLADRMSGDDIPEEIRRACAHFRDELGGAPDATARLVSLLISSGKNSGQLEPRTLPGAVRYLGWRALERVLRPWAESLTGWMKDSLWGRPYCPLCGSPPAMAQLVRTKKGRERFLSCGCCRSRWSYQRSGCPFCGNEDQEKLGILEMLQEEDLRIDVCRSCNSYLKTYTNEGDEEFLLADWSTLHLDILAAREGFQRRAHSLYEL